MKINYPIWVKDIINILHSNGYEAYLVGGCVRDSILNKSINDYDITTNALPSEMVELFNSEGYTVIPTGIVHGTVTILKYKHSVEITTYRIDNEYINNRKPKAVTFTSSLYEDLKRRDFTINAMAYNDLEGLIDPLNGLSDLNNKTIKAVGNPILRFHEDALRILRCIRFSCTLNFKIDRYTTSALISSYYLLNNIAKERIRDELCKILLSDRPNLLIALKDYKVLELIIPEYTITLDFDQNNKWHIYNLFDHMNIALNATKGLPLTCKLAIL
ncbi:MAG: [cytidine(C)-cytidine(C)-adenosine (A)]-adding enzyme, partial [Erysipelotrichaceae bacterium]